MTSTERVAGRVVPYHKGERSEAPRDTTVDLLAELDALADMANEARKQIAAGYASTGSSALQRIQYRATDAARWAREERTRA